MASAAKLLLLFLRMMISGEEEDISEIGLLFFFGLNVSFDELRPLVVVGVKLFKDLLHGTFLRLKSMLLMFNLQRQMLQIPLKRWRE